MYIIAFKRTTWKAEKQVNNELLHNLALMEKNKGKWNGEEMVKSCAEKGRKSSM